MNFESLKTGFIEYLKTKYKVSRSNPDKFDNLDKDSSIFLYANDFKQYLKKVNLEHNLNLSVDENNSNSQNNSLNNEDDMILQALMDASKLQDSDNANEDNDSTTDANGNINDSNDLMSELLNSFFSDESVKGKADLDGDGTITTDEENQFFKSNNTDLSSLTFDELAQLYNSIKEESSTSQDAQSQTPISTPEGGSSSTSSTSAGSSGRSSGSGGGGDSSTDTQTQESAGNGGSKDYSSMTAEELDSELKAANANLEEKQKAKNNIINGQDETLSGLQEDIDEKEKQYQTTMNEVAPELAAKYQEAKSALDAHNQDIANTQVAINEKQATVDSLNSSIQELGKQITSYDSAISKLNSKKGAEDAPEDLSARISELETKRSEAQRQKGEKEEQLSKETPLLEDLKNKLTDLETATPQKEQALQEIQAEIDKLDNEDLQTLKSAVDDAQNTYNEKKAALETEAETAINEAKAEVDKIQAELSTKRMQEIESKGNTDNARSIYDSLGLEAKGLSFEKFNFMVEGYNNLEDKGSGRVSVVDEVNHMCYVIDMEKKTLEGTYQVSTGYNSNPDIDAGNAKGKGGTPGGWLKITGGHNGRKYKSNESMNLDGMEEFNKNTLSRSVIAHHIGYSIGYTTAGCLGFKESGDTIVNKIMKKDGLVFVIKDGMVNANSEYRKRSKYYTAKTDARTT